MVWAKRRMRFHESEPYSDMMQKLLSANPALYQEFLMFFVISEVRPMEPDYYIGLPNKTLLAHFDRFQEVSEAQLPKEVSKIVFSGAGSSKEEPFASRFKFKNSDKFLDDD